MNRGRTDRIVLTVSSDLRYGEAVRALIDVLSKRLEHETGTDSLNAHVISAYNEAFNNIVEHAYGGARDGQVDIEITIHAERLEIAMIDQGRGFDVASVEAPDLVALPEGGLGIMIIRSFMNKVEYSSSEGSNVLRMVKHFTGPRLFSEELQGGF